MRSIKTYLTLILSAISFMAAAQPYYTGLTRDEAAERAVPQKATLLTRSYEILPKRHSLVQYCPVPMSQGQYGTCTSWAAAYAARTIAEAVNKKWTDVNVITRNAFSPPFVYKHIKDRSDSDCQAGSPIPSALKLMQERGVPRFNDFNVWCANTVPQNIYQSALSHKIDSYTALFYSDSPSEKKVSTTKKAVSQNCPVVICMNIYASFYNAGDSWNGMRDSNLGYHAMCVVGYDDDKNGGSFLLMNSWGKNWGNKGFTWVSYKDFCHDTDYAAEIYVKPQGNSQPKPTPTPTPKPKPDNLIVPLPQPSNVTNTLAGSMYLQLATGEKVEAMLTQAPVPYYKAKGEYISGTRYRIYVSNDAPAYVYVIGSDLQNNVSKVFPPADNISPALTYTSNEIAIPDEKWYIQMDNTVGKDYLCVLYSAYSLPINDIVKAIGQVQGTFYEKVQKVLGTSRVPNSDIKISGKDIRFKTTTTGIVMPLIVEVTHK